MKRTKHDSTNPVMRPQIIVLPNWKMWHSRRFAPTEWCLLLGIAICRPVPRRTRRSQSSKPYCPPETQLARVRNTPQLARREETTAGADAKYSITGAGEKTIAGAGAADSTTGEGNKPAGAGEMCSAPSACASDKAGAGTRNSTIGAGAGNTGKKTRWCG